MNKLKVVLLANTGLGNEVLINLLKLKNIVVDSVCTRKLDGKFPYYEECELYKLAEKNNINCFYNININEEYYNYLKNRDIDLIIVASFNQIIKKHIIKLPKKGIINFHPSLLPLYRGPNPINWVLLNGEKLTGVSVHYLTDKVDAGDIIYQKSINIKDNDNMGTLFKKISKLSGSIVSKVIPKFYSNYLPVGISQNSKEATYYKKPMEFRKLKNNMPYKEFVRRLKAFHPFPSAILLKEGERFLVEDYFIENFENKLYISDDYNYHVDINGNKIYLKIKKNI